MKRTLATWGWLCILATILHAEEWDLSVKKASVDPKVPVTEDILFANPDLVWAAGFGLIGSVIATSVMDEEDLRSALKKQNVQVDRFVFDAFSKQLSSNKTLHPAFRTSGDATFHLKVTGYGLDIEAGGSDLIPYLEVEARLLKPNGQLIWEETCSVTGADGGDDPDEVPVHSLDDYMEKDGLLKEAFLKAAQVVSAELFHELDLAAAESEPTKSRHDSLEAAPPSKSKPGSSVSKKGM